MATLIPSFSSCSQRMTSGERRFAQRLEDKLEDDYLIWYDIPVGKQRSHPDFILLHPLRGLIVLEVKDWKLS
ncbi:MAG: nuclease-related domain-containing protein, partial [Cyanobacteria bacterium J06633_2]